MNVLSKNQFQFQRIAFVLLFVLSNLLFFQPTQAQPFDHYSGYTCNNESECNTWQNDSLVLYLPAPNEDCHYKFYFKWRFDDCNDIYHLVIQPVSILLDFVNSDCGASVKAFYGDTNNIHRIESLMRLAEKTMVFNHTDLMYLNSDSIYKGFYDYDTISLSPLVIDSTLTGNTSLKTSFIRPACRGLCISYIRADSTSTIDSVYAKWHNCGNACCEIISSFVTIGHLTNVPSAYLNDGITARIDVEVNYTGDCGSTPSVACPNSSTNKKVTKFKSCRDYCQDENGLDPFGLSTIDNDRGIVNLNDKPVFSDKYLRELPDNKILQSNNNSLDILVSEEVNAIKIVTLDGVVLSTHNRKDRTKIISISLNTLQNSLYLIVFETRNGVTSKPIIISR